MFPTASRQKLSTQETLACKTSRPSSSKASKMNTSNPLQLLSLSTLITNPSSCSSTLSYKINNNKLKSIINQVHVSLWDSIICRFIFCLFELEYPLSSLYHLYIYCVFQQKKKYNQVLVYNICTLGIGTYSITFCAVATANRFNSSSLCFKSCIYSVASNITEVFLCYINTKKDS